MASEIASKLEASRRDLLDLGLRNPLLNFRSRTRRIDIVDELSIEVFRILVAEAKRMRFAPLPEELIGGDGGGLPGLFEQDEPDWTALFANGDVDEAGRASRHVDTRLQTRLGAKALHVRLLAIHRDAQTYLGEQGVNILYVALGFLHWYESPDSQQERMAPLVLVPVELARGSVAEQFSVMHPDEEIGENLSLIEKLRAEFAIQLPALGDSESIDLQAYYDGVSGAIRGQTRWRIVQDEIVLGFFSFGKFLMYKDLDIKAWPTERPPDDHPILTGLLGGGFTEPPLISSDDANVDAISGANNLHHILDADSSQILAMLDVGAGRNIVIQGPPGTGKSQTIANIIAESICDGKKVLFVSEKMAALEVVKRRLDNVGLGDAVLELHSHKTRKRAVLDEIRRTLEAGQPRAGDLATDAQSLAALRDRLNEYCHAVNTPIAPFGVRPVDAIGQFLLLGGDARGLPRLDFSAMRAWTQATYREHRLRVEELQRRLQTLGVPRQSPFWGVRTIVLLPSDEMHLRELVEEAHASGGAIARESSALAKMLLMPTPAELAGVARLCRAAAKAIEAPDLSGIGVVADDWRSRREDLTLLMETGRRLTELHDRFEGTIKDEAWNQDLATDRQRLLAYGKKWWRYLSGRYRSSRAHLASLLKVPLPKEADRCVEIIDSVVEGRQLQQVYAAFETLGMTLFGQRWRGRKSDWDQLAKLASWMAAVHTDIAEGKLPREILDYLQEPEPAAGLRESLAQLVAGVRRYQDRLKVIETMLELRPDSSGAVRPQPWVMQPLSAVEERLRLWLARWDELRQLVSFNAFDAELRDLGLTTVLGLAEHWGGGSHDLVRVFDATWYEGVIGVAYRERKALQRFDSASHEHAAEQFRKLDHLSLACNAAHIASQHWSRLPWLSHGGEMGVIHTELNKKRRHLPIRQLVGQAGRALQQVKPIFMMSPLSIANFLPPKSVTFDLAIFDEASQVKPVDAFGAVLRTQQVVVVGDTKQLPPTTFFESLSADDNEATDSTNVTADLESILAMFLARRVPPRMLRWHYRSRHESLIAVSNHEFYDNKLVIFPSPDRERATLGLRFHHLPETVYGRGQTRTNLGEALVVAERVMWYARERPELTLGVAAFSASQRDAVEAQLEILRRRDPSLEEYFVAHPHEPFFVKNLENVQGDERDVILISIGYGKTEEGYLAMSFGPLNQDGGERRLNVLITRARCICEVFSNFTADEIDLRRAPARGVAALKTFLTYARDHRLDVPKPVGTVSDSPFEEAVMRALRSHGYEVHPQVGTGGFRVDLGVVDADKPGRYLLGIECDGASYHSARSARDRDRLRQIVLEGLGWRIHRIWSTDWFTNPDKTLRSTVEAIEKARAYWSGKDHRAFTSANANSPRRDVAPIARVKPTRESPPEQGIVYRCADIRIRLLDEQLHELRVQDFSRHVEAVVDIEGPVHVEIVITRITSGAGMHRAGNRIRDAIENGIQQACCDKLVSRCGDFLLKPGKAIVVRSRMELPAQERKLNYVAPEEILLALQTIVRRAFSIAMEEAISRTCGMLGFSRVSAQMAEAVTKIIDELAMGAGITRDGMLLVWRPDRDA